MLAYRAFLAVGIWAGLKLASKIPGAQPAQVSYSPMPQLPPRQLPSPEPPDDPATAHEIADLTPEQFAQAGGISEAMVHSNAPGVSLVCSICNVEFRVLSGPNLGRLTVYRSDVDLINLSAPCPGPCNTRIVSFESATLQAAVKAGLEIVLEDKAPENIRKFRTAKPAQAEILRLALQNVEISAAVEELIASLN